MSSRTFTVSQTTDVDGQVSEQLTAGEKCLVFLAITISWLLFPITVWGMFTSVRQWERAYSFRFGKSRSGKQGLDPGLHLVYSVDTFTTVDMRNRVYDIPIQQVLTKDSVGLKVNGVGYWRVVDAWKCLMDVNDFEEATQNIMGTTLRNCLSGRTLVEILAAKNIISEEVSKMATAATIKWGVEVISVDMNDIILPQELLASLACEAQARREAAAKVISAKGDLKAAECLSLAAQELDKGGSAALVLKYISEMQNVVHSRTKVIVVPTGGLSL